MLSHLYMDHGVLVEKNIVTIHVVKVNKQREVCVSQYHIVRVS